MKRSVCHVSLMLVGALLCAVGATAQETEISPIRLSLTGLEAVSVTVENISDSEARRAGLTPERVKTDVELRLRQLGVPVRDDASEYLYVNVNLIDTNEGLWAYSISVDLRQYAYLYRDLDIGAYGTTWSRGSIGTVGARKLATIRDAVKDYVDAFANDYLAGNSSRYKVSLLESKAGRLAAYGQNADALEVFRDILELEPNTPDIHYNIGLMHYQLLDYREAIASFQQHLTLYPDDEEVLYRVFLAHWGIAKDLEDAGQADMARPEHEASIPVLQELLSMNFGEVVYHRALARVYEKLGMVDEAQHEQEVAERMTSDGSE